jgi:NADH-quinone oxidoreductase subunit I
MNIFRKTFSGLRGLLSGMGLTFKYFVRFDKVITQQYPENRAELKMPPRFRGSLELIKDTETEQYRCSACGLCVKACPNNSIAIEKERDPATKKMRLTKYEYRLDRCTLCGLCVESCKFTALRMGQQFETAVYSREELTRILNEDPRPPAAQVQPEKASPGTVPPANPTEKEPEPKEGEQ